ncbi:unnamed protein product [Strongylus vulgaris]|uniref:Glycine zipper domain-containing protein n=1 Tax=Strongylus vulgaris TaxID=40348 RepID=A0A3P7L8X8_STRVU|nr:unnamed protein product [Strongylus vulgaris]
MSTVYLDQVLKILESSKPFRKTMTGVAKQTGYAAAGTAAGGLLMGPIGALAGGVLGVVYGYQCSANYDNLICSLRSLILESSKPFRKTVTGVAKQTGYAAAGTAAGGLLMGPIGALAGGVIGVVYGYQSSTNYDNLLCSLRSLSDKEKTLISGQIQRLVGSTAIEELIRYISTKRHRKLLFGILSDFVRHRTP